MSPLSSEPASPSAAPPCVVYEDEDLVVVNKPPGWNTHSPAPHAGEGLYEWLRHREPRWSGLGIVHRLDKDTSGLMVFGRSTLAHRSLTEQFTRHAVGKHYLCLTDRPVPKDDFITVSALVRAGDRYFSRPLAAGGVRAETRFRVLRREGARTWLEAEPVTGKTHQIRVHASETGFPLLGDSLYGGTSAPRLALHSRRLQLLHPRDGRSCEWEVDPDFSIPASEALRSGLFHCWETDAFRLCHGTADGRPGWLVDAWGNFWLAQGAADRPEKALLEWHHQRSVARPEGPLGLYFKRLRRDVRATKPDEARPEWVQGPHAPATLVVRENGVAYEVSFQAGYSVGLFLDQRDNRRRLLRRHIGADFPLDPAAGEILNTFSYTCAFSVCAALGGWRTVSLDLSRKYLDWGRRNFVHNALDPSAHDFVHGDVYDWLRRWMRKQRRFVGILLDPPTFSRSAEAGDFRAETDYGRLVQAAIQVLQPGGFLLASTNAARLAPTDFLAQVHEAIATTGRQVLCELYVPQPPDFPISREEPAYLKTVWLRIR